jgi:hypothetical protein
MAFHRYNVLLNVLIDASALMPVLIAVNNAKEDKGKSLLQKA